MDRRKELAAWEQGNQAVAICSPFKKWIEWGSWAITQ